jgi:CRP/FNR family transcriptional regulator, anaerobic regulatory protein
VKSTMQTKPNVRHVQGTASVVSMRAPQMLCRHCNCRELCVPRRLSGDEIRQFEAVVGPPLHLAKYQVLYRAGDPFTALYAIRVGSFKTSVLAEDGREQVAGNHIMGEIIGLDGIAADAHACQAAALEESEVCVLPFATMETLARSIPILQHNLYQMLSREVGRDHNLMLQLGSTRAEGRLADFLLNLSERYRQRGYSPNEFVLRMTREEIGSHLGLTLETVSRLFSRFQAAGVIQVQGREVKLLDLQALKDLAG